LTRTVRQRAIAVVALALALWAPRARAQAPPDSTDREHPPIPIQTPWLERRPDLYQHASLAFASGLAVGLASEKPAAAAATAIALGVLKESLDGHFDRSDLLADLVRAGLAAWATYALSR